MNHAPVVLASSGAKTPKAPVSFVTWLAGEAHRDDAVGDLARDVVRDRADGCLPSTVGAFAGLRRHLWRCHDYDLGAESAIKDALSEAITDWKREMRNRRWSLSFI